MKTFTEWRLDNLIAGIKNLFVTEKPIVKTAAKMQPSRNNYAFRASEFESKIFGQCGAVCRFLQRYGYQGGIPNKACGSEGCAYFLGDKVAKMTFGKDEYTLAKQLQGSDLVPVIDTFYDNSTGVYVIMMQRLSELPQQKKQEIDCGAQLIKQYINSMAERGYAVSDFKSQLNPKEFQKYVAKTGAKCTTAAQELLQIVMSVYQKTGMLLHRDLGSGNVMGKNQVVDMGYPIRYEDL